MDNKTEKQMAKMVEALQPHCDEQIIAAMTCSHAGSMSSLFISKLFGGFGAGAKSSNLPNPSQLSPKTPKRLKVAKASK